MSQQTPGYSIVTFERMNFQITLHRDEISYCLAIKGRINTKRISDSLGEYIKKTYKPGQFKNGPGSNADAISPGN